MAVWTQAHRRLCLVLPLTFLYCVVELMNCADKSIRNLPHCLQQGTRPGRRQPERPRRRAQGSRDQQVGRRRAEEGMLLDGYMSAPSTTYYACISRKRRRYALERTTTRCAERLDTPVMCKCPRVMSSFTASRMSHLVVYPLSTSASCFCLYCRRLAVLGRAGLQVCVLVSCMLTGFFFFCS